MKFAGVAYVCLAASVAPRLAQGDSNDFDELFNLVEKLQEEVTELSITSVGKDAEISSLIEQLTTCEEGRGLRNKRSRTSNDDNDATPPTASTTSGQDDRSIEYSTSGPSPPADDLSSSSSSSSPTDIGSSTSTGGGSGFAFRKGQSWNYNLKTPVDTNVDVDVVAIDMAAGQDIIDTLHGKGKGVVCYISIGTFEDWRSDADEFPSSAIGRSLGDWPGEKWVDVNNDQVRAIMAARVKVAAGMKCDGIEPDHMMVYMESGTGVDVSENQQIEYNRWFAEVVHSNGMGVGLKNAIELVPILVNDFDFALNEECNEWDECEVYGDTFLAEGKPVFNVEYSLGMSVCDSTNALGMDTIIKSYDLDADLCSCVDSSRDVNC